MSQTIALQAGFKPVDLPGMVQAGQQARLRDIQLQNAPLESEVERMGLEDKRGRLSALADYREQAKAGNQVDGLSALNAYPDEQANIYDELHNSYGGLTFDERQKALRRADAFARGAQYVLSFPMGSPEQEQAWTSTLGVLRKDGFIDEETYRLWMQSGPTQEALDAAISMKEYLDNQVDPKTGEIRARTKLSEARIEDIGIDNARADSEAQNRNKNRDARTERPPRPDTMSQSQILTTKRTIRNELMGLERELQGLAKEGLVDVASIPGELAKRRAELEDYYGISLDGSPEDGAPATGADTGADANPAIDAAASETDEVLTAPPPMESRVVGKVYTTTKGRFIWTGEGWKPAE